MRIIIFALAAGLVACADSTAPEPDTTFFSYTSTPGDWIGQGESRHYSFEEGRWQASFDSNAETEHIVIHVDGLPGASWWNLDFAAPQGQRLAEGTYPNARRWPFQGSTQPGLNVSGEGRGCNTLTGSFVIHALTLGPGNTVDRFHATFDQYCEGASPLFSGEISIVANPWR